MSESEDRPVTRREIDQRFIASDKVTVLLKESSERAVGAAKIVQTAHDAATNEWQKTFRDVRDNTATRAEFERLEKDFNAYKLEMARTIEAKQTNAAGAERGAQEQKTESRAGTATIVAIAVGIGTFLNIMFNMYNSPRQAAAPPVVYSPAPQMVIPQGMMLVPSTQTQTK